MGYRVGYVKRGSVRRVRRHRRNQRIVAIFAVPLLIGFVVCFAVWLIAGRSRSAQPHFTSALNPEWTRGNASQNLAMLAGHVDVAMPTRTGRAVYPYSIVPGGVRTPEELQAITEHDRLVAKHYSGFDFRKAKVIELKRPALMYLSYRMRDKIFWTKKQIALRQGEKLITDGKITARTRCANRVEVLPQAAIAPDEPLAEQFDDPFAEGGSATKVDFPGNFQSALNGLRNLQSASYSDPVEVAASRRACSLRLFLDPARARRQSRNTGIRKLPRALRRRKRIPAHRAVRRRQLSPSRAQFCWLLQA